MNVTPIGTPNLKDVPGSLRRLADLIESGTEGKIVRAIVIAVDDEGEIITYGYGEIGTRDQETGTIFMAAIKMAIV